MDIKNLRNEINEIDKRLLPLFVERMKTAGKIAQYKRDNSLAIYDAARERELLASVFNSTEKEFGDYALVLYTTLLSLSRSYQHKLIGEKSTAAELIQTALEASALFPESARIACQGVEGAFSQLAADKLFRVPSILFFNSFEGVFSAIESGLCEYGVLPIENSTAGSVKRIFDLMIDRSFYIVRSIRVKVEHSLLARPGTRLEDIDEIYSHEQAIEQCSGYLKDLKNIKITACPNTAIAAKAVADAQTKTKAAICSSSCAEIYGLNILSPYIQDQSNNYTRFICISKKPQIFPGADRTSIMLVTPHKPGALFNILSTINALGLNLLKLESRPMPEREFEFMFYFDIEVPAQSPKLPALLSELETGSEAFRYLGTYAEVNG